MKSPLDIRLALVRQWHKPAIRTARLLSADDWPLRLPIGKPSARVLAEQPSKARQHIVDWRAVEEGEVVWASASYRATADNIQLPLEWVFQRPSQWVEATQASLVQSEFRVLEKLIEQADSCFHEVFIREWSSWREKPLEELLSASSLAMALGPGCAKGKPLRLLAGHDVDTKFFQRNSRLLTRLLDERFDGEASEQGLSNFLGAWDEKDHWLLVVPLAQGLLPFQRQRVRAAELREAMLPASHILVVENEQCLHLLPQLPDTIAVLGAGLNLQWLDNQQLSHKHLAYWGDMDTWGLLMLSRARQYQPKLRALLMTQTLFEQHKNTNAVPEPATAGDVAPNHLTPQEKSFYCQLLNQSNGRLEQEYLPQDMVHAALNEWFECCSQPDLG